ncbi:IS66 family insertion sequence element accessory protein TnpB [Pelomonas aquatica]|uniref:IS66 family insertion sequence element accessory protein TnpB n=1 Tax=Pelomonas aquatica TaxID=431058 RepID=UPI0038F5DB7A
MSGTAKGGRSIRIDAMWMTIEPIDMRARPERLLARVVQVFGAGQAHHGYLFANARGTRIKLLVRDGFGVWCAARHLNAVRFSWACGPQVHLLRCSSTPLPQTRPRCRSVPSGSQTVGVRRTHLDGCMPTAAPIPIPFIKGDGNRCSQGCTQVVLPRVWRRYFPSPATGVGIRLAGDGAISAWR